MSFEDIVYTHIHQIPFGHTMSYGQIARLAGYPNHARQVGKTLKNLPKDTQLPWHRVINAQGKISFPQDSEQYNEQLKRLQNEGVAIKNGRIAKKYFLG